MKRLLSWSNYTANGREADRWEAACFYQTQGGSVGDNIGATGWF